MRGLRAATMLDPGYVARQLEGLADITQRELQWDLQRDPDFIEQDRLPVLLESYRRVVESLDEDGLESLGFLIRFLLKSIAEPLRDYVERVAPLHERLREHDPWAVYTAEMELWGLVLHLREQGVDVKERRPTAPDETREGGTEC
jgi:hypothetical protein